MSEPSFLAWQFPPHRILPRWLGETRTDGLIGYSLRDATRTAGLIAYSLAAETRFLPTKLNDNGPGHHNAARLDEVVRHSCVLKDLGAFAGPLRRKALALQAGLE